jgi:hypothetical protein
MYGRCAGESVAASKEFGSIRIDPRSYVAQVVRVLAKVHKPSRQAMSATGC